MHPLPIWFWVRHRHYRFVSWRQGQPSALHQPIEPNRALALADLWMRQGLVSDPSVRGHLIKLHVELALSSGPYCGVGTAFLATWLRQQIVRGQVLVYEVLPEMGEGESHEEYARDIGLSMPSAAVLPAPSETVEPYHVYAVAGGATRMQDEFTAECPDPSFRSESMETAGAEVLQWLKSHDRPSGWRETLGADGGGGFLATTTRVTTIRAGTILYRYSGGEARDIGVWWFESPFVGDARSFGALPKENFGNILVQGKVKTDVESLCGLGAPRCSNKPGGPLQFRIPWSPTRQSAIAVENDFVVLV
jgi:hypothetical protein